MTAPTPLTAREVAEIVAMLRDGAHAWQGLAEQPFTTRAGAEAAKNNAAVTRRIADRLLLLIPASPVALSGGET